MGGASPTAFHANVATDPGDPPASPAFGGDEYPLRAARMPTAGIEAPPPSFGTMGRIPAGARSAIHEAPTVAQRPLQPHSAPHAPPPQQTFSELPVEAAEDLGTLDDENSPQLRLQDQDRSTTQPRRKGGGGIVWILVTAVVVGGGGMAVLSYTRNDSQEVLHSVEPASAPNNAHLQAGALAPSDTQEPAVTSGTIDDATDSTRKDSTRKDTPENATGANGQKAAEANGDPSAAASLSADGPTQRGGQSSADNTGKRSATAKGPKSRTASKSKVRPRSKAPVERSTSKRPRPLRRSEDNEDPRPATEIEAAQVAQRAKEPSGDDLETTRSIESAREALRALGGDDLGDEVPSSD